MHVSDIFSFYKNNLEKDEISIWFFFNLDSKNIPGFFLSGLIPINMIKRQCINGFWKCTSNLTSLNFFYFKTNDLTHGFVWRLWIKISDPYKPNWPLFITPNGRQTYRILPFESLNADKFATVKCKEMWLDSWYLLR